VKVAILVLLAGCSYAVMRPRPDGTRSCSSLPVIADGVGAIGALGVGLIGFQSLDQEPTAPKAVPAVETAAGVIATVAFIVSSVHGQRLLRTCGEASRAAIDTEPARRAASREAAYALTKQAATAARAGDCAKVKSLAGQVKEANAEFYDVVFVRDVAIAKCMR
jgi:hypothetical protein